MWGQGFGPAAGLLAGVPDRDYVRLGGSFIAGDAERKLGGRAEALAPRFSLTESVPYNFGA